MSEADTLEFLGYLMLAYTLGWGVGMLVYAFKRGTELL